MEAAETSPGQPPAGPTAGPGKPWGLWTTLGFGVVIAAIYLGISVAVFFGFVAYQAAAGAGEVDANAIAASGLYFATASFASSAVCTLLVIGCVALRKGIGVSDYLGLKRPRWRHLLIWPLLLAVIFTPLEWVRIEIVGKPLVPEFMLDAYRSCDFLPILWLAVVVGAPVGEEFFFRGFLFEGIRNSRLGGAGAVIVCATSWAVIHLQYDLIDMSVVFLGGLFLGMAKLRTGNLWIPVFLHFVWNLIAMIQTVWVAGQPN